MYLGLKLLEVCFTDSKIEVLVLFNYGFHDCRSLQIVRVCQALMFQDVQSFFNHQLAFL